MEWQLDKNLPIIPQLTNTFCVCIANGTYKSGEKLQSVREIALEAGVNPNTVQKAFEDLARRGIIRSERSIGWFVCEDTQEAGAAVKRIIRQKTDMFFGEMLKLGVSIDETKKIVEEWRK